MEFIRPDGNHTFYQMASCKIKGIPAEVLMLIQEPGYHVFILFPVQRTGAVHQNTARFDINGCGIQ